MVGKPWWHRPLTIADLEIMGADEVLKINPAELAEKKKQMGFNAEHLTCSDIYGGEKGIFYFKTKIAKSVPRDFFSEYIPEAHKRGIKVLAYYNVHWIHVDFGREHPEWLQVDSKGRIIDDLYGSGNAPCVNSPSWRRFSLQGIRDLASYDIDGIFLDGPIFAPEACYCKSCQEKFRQKYGLELPREKNWKDPAWRKFIEFRYDSIAEYLRDAAKTLKESRPRTVIYMNCTGLWPSWPAARDNRRLMSYQDILGAEGGFLYYDLRTISLWKPGMTAKILETQAEGKPTVVFISGAHHCWGEYLLTPVETKLLYADSIANGANPWYGIPHHLTDKPGALAAGEMNHFILNNAEFLEDTVSLAYVAVFWSSRTADFYRASIPTTDFTPHGERAEKRASAGNFYASFLGCYEALVRSHIPFDILDEEALKPNILSRYDLIIAPNCACISEDKAGVLSGYVREGGNLIASFETSRYDEYGDLLDDFRLSEIFGVSVSQGTFGPMDMDYMSIVNRHPVFEGVSADMLPSPIYGIEVSPGTARTIAMYHEKMPSRYVKVPPISKNPSITINTYGKGRCLYIAGNLFEHYHKYHCPDHRRIIANSARWMSKPLVTLSNAPQSVEVTVRRQLEKNRILIHLVNFTGEMTRPMESVVPIRDVEVIVHGFRICGRAKALRLGKDLEIKPNEDSASFIIPIIQEYEVIVLKTAE